MQEKRGLVESKEEEEFLVDDDNVEKVNEDICLSSGEEGPLFEAKEGKDLQEERGLVQSKESFKVMM